MTVEAKGAGSVRNGILSALALVLVTFVAFRGVTRGAFLDLDDRTYVTANPRVAAGIEAEGVGWAFTTLHASNWHPLTWLSHMADVELFGMDPAAHHAVNLVLHTIAALLLLRLLSTLGLGTAPAFLAAALFAVHPLRVESVAWVSERKDVLSGALWLGSLLAYVQWTRRGGPGRYALLLLLSSATLLAKPTGVTLPFVMLLLDRWPLDRLRTGELGRRFVEKAPLFLLAVAGSLVTVEAQRRGGSIPDAETLSLGARLANVPVAYVHYLRATVLPTGSSFFVPHPSFSGEGWSPLRVAGCSLVLVLATAGVLVMRGRRPWLLIGWLWFLGVLVPMIGLVQVGAQAWADRYTYLSQIGLVVLVVREALEWARARPGLARAAGITGLAVVLACVFLTRAQVETWRDEETLAHQALELDPGNWRAHGLRAAGLRRSGDAQGAAAALREAVALQSGQAALHYNLANVLDDLGDPEAEAHYRRAIEIDPAYGRAHFNLALLLRDRGDVHDAITHFESATRTPGIEAVAQLELGKSRLLARDLVGGINALERALAVDPMLDEARELRNAARAALDRP